MSYASNRAKAVLQDAEQQAQTQPSSSLLAFAAQGRTVQEATRCRFLDEVVQRITAKSTAAHSAPVTTCTILMYQLGPDGGNQPRRSGGDRLGRDGDDRHGRDGGKFYRNTSTAAHRDLKIAAVHGVNLKP
jgi:hypothetical protein